MNLKLYLLKISLAFIIFHCGGMISAQSSNLIVIDKDFAQKSKLLTSLPPNATILNLDGVSNPWKMIREKLKSDSKLKNIHLFVESGYKSLLMGGIEYTDAAVDAEDELPMLEGLYFGTHYQLLLYTCNLPSNPEGLELIKKIGEKSYFNVAASTDCTDIFNQMVFDFTSLNQPTVSPIITN